MSMLDFDFDGARNAGASNDQIYDFLKQNYSDKFDFNGAEKAGASRDDIVNFLSQNPQNSPNLETEQKKEPQYNALESIKQNIQNQSQTANLGYAPIGQSYNQLDYDRTTTQEQEQEFQNLRAKQAKPIIENRHGVFNTIHKNFIADDEVKEKYQIDTMNQLSDFASKNGFDLGIKEIDGKIYGGRSILGGRDKEIIDITPDIMDYIGASKGEIALGTLGAVLSGGTSLPFMLGASATGTSLGAMSDYRNYDEITGNKATAADYLKRGGEAVIDDLGAGLILGGAIKGLGKGANILKEPFKGIINTTAELGGKVWDNLPISSVVRQFGTDNIGGATDKAIKNLGGETEYLTSLNQAKEALGDKAFSEFANERVIQIPHTKFETINKGIDFVNDKLVKPFNENIKKVVSQADLNEQEANLFLANLAHENGAKIITNSVAHDPQAYGKAVQMFKKLNGTTKQTLDEVLKDSPSVIKVFDDFEKRTKADFGAVMDTLNEFFSKNAPQSTELIKSNKRRILTNARQIFGDSDELSKFTGTLKKPTNLNEWQDLRNLIGNEIGSIERNGKKFGLNSQDNATLRLLRTIRNDIDSSIDDIFNQFEKTHPNLGERAKELINTARKDYHAYKNMEYSDLYHTISTGIKDEAKITDILIKSVNNENGADLNAFLSALGNKERANAESAIIRAVIAKNTAENITDFKAVLDTLNELPLQSEKALSVLNHLNDNAPILKNTGEILNDLKTINPKGYELSQGISHSIKARIKTMIANRLTNKLKSKAPLGFGDNQALQNHINNAIKGSGNLEIALKNIAEIPAENLPSNARVALEAFKKDFANFSAEIKAEVTQDIKQTLKEMSDNGEIDILEMVKNIKPKQQADQVAENLAQAEAKQTENVGKFGDEADILAMARERNANAVKEPIKGNGFTMSKDGKITFLDEAKFELNQELQNKTGLQDKITTSLAWLQDKHPEMFANKRAVKEVIDYVLNEPQIIKPAKSENSVFMGKMDNEKIKDIVVNKDENKIIHATHRKPSKAEKADSGDALPPHSDTMSDGALKLADKQRLSAFNDDIISQNAKHSDFLNKKTDLGVIKEVYELPNGELQFLINGEWIHERTASFTNLKAIRELIRKPNLDKFDIWRLKSVKRNFDLNRGDKSSQIAKEIDLYNDEFAYKTRRKGEQLDNAQRLYQGIETRLDEVKKQTENLPPKPKTGAELKAEFDDLAEKYDIEQFLKDRENISANDIRYTRTAVNGSSSRTSRKNADGTYTYSKPEMEHNYKADFAFTKSDVAKLRKQIQSGEFDENLLNKLKNDLDGAEPQGYTNYLKSADDIAESKAEKEFKQTGKEPEIKELKDGRIWDNKHGKYIYMFSNESLGGGLLGGSVSGIQTDENGNITGFDPAKFAVGFGAGFGAMKLGANAGIKDKANAVKANLKAKQMQEKGKKFAEFCNRALKTDNKAVFDFGELSEKQVNSLRKIKNDLGQIREFNFSGYTLKIDSATIRHIKNNHPDDLKYLTNLGDIYENSTSARWALNRNEKGQSELSITLYKKYSNGELGAVEIVDTGDKTLNLKTFYKVDKE
ncbi:hypothetical protein OFN70_07460 [Campylobacter sp. CN_NE3]|uniref:PBECR3 domain-containing polyvalent protein n=1 Tax=Campylobacter sp. CN_NE3 TaxID=2984149 RepID=UPI0022E9FB14|nr:hypothetical protein [Campylobacter sp. CN_NE3]MDA3069361.1 hypothetical protein [Campylobacter sp. CN_NE3]